MKTLICVCAALVASVAVQASGFLVYGPQRKAAGGRYYAYIGPYTGEKSKGIYVSRFDSKSGSLSSPELAAESTNPSFLAAHPNGRYIYAVNEVSRFEGQKSGYVSAFEIDRGSGKLTLLNKVSSRGTGPCHLVLDKSGKNILVANYGSGSVAVLPIKKDGQLGEAFTFIQHTGSSVNPKRQEGPHAHCLALSADNRFAFVADLGLDRIMIYRFDAQMSTLAPNDPPFVKVNPGAGPRHFLFHPNGRFAYVINEIQSTVTAFAYDAERGSLKELQTISTLPEGFSGQNSTAEIQVARSGKYLYGSNRGNDTIAVFSVDQRKGTLTPVERVSTQGKVPRNFNLDPTGSFLIAANQNSNSVVLFGIDRRSGRLRPTGHSIEVFSPVCIEFVPID
ncbi:MAG TPA: lactonase family protein [Acidobacteriota bacterium]|nr:lactonase family protein [Acidobacteriota bacterium]